MIKSIESYNS